jgi:hypothetical protein
MSWDTPQLEKTIMNLSTLGKICSLALLIAILMPASPASAQMNPVDLGVKIGEKIGGKIIGGGKSVVRGAAKVLNPAGGRHDKVTPIYIDGKRAFLLDIYDDKGSRCTLDFDLETRFQGRLWLVGGDPMLQTQMEFQRKGNKRLRPDPNRGPRVRNGSRVDMTGGRNYFAERVVNWSPALEAKFPNASILLLEDGLTLERFYQWLDQLAMHGPMEGLGGEVSEVVVLAKIGPAEAISPLRLAA